MIMLNCVCLMCKCKGSPRLSVAFIVCCQSSVIFILINLHNFVCYEDIKCIHIIFNFIYHIYQYKL